MLTDSGVSTGATTAGVLVVAAAPTTTAESSAHAQVSGGQAVFVDAVVFTTGADVSTSAAVGA